MGTLYVTNCQPSCGCAPCTFNSPHWETMFCMHVGGFCRRRAISILRGHDGLSVWAAHVACVCCSKWSRIARASGNCHSSIICRSIHRVNTRILQVRNLPIPKPIPIIFRKLITVVTTVHSRPVDELGRLPVLGVFLGQLTHRAKVVWLVGNAVRMVQGHNSGVIQHFPGHEVQGAHSPGCDRNTGEVLILMLSTLLSHDTNNLASNRKYLEAPESMFTLVTTSRA